MEQSKLEFTEFYRLHYRLAFYYTVRKVCSQPDSEDILAESFLALYQSWQKIREGNYKNYFFRILQNQINSFLRKHYQLEIVAVSDDLAELENYQYLDRTSKLKSLVFEKLALCTKADQQYFRLKYQDNLSVKEIAEQLKISPNNAKVINNRLIKKLKKLCFQ